MQMSHGNLFASTSQVGKPLPSWFSWFSWDPLARWVLMKVADLGCETRILGRINVFRSNFHVPLVELLPRVGASPV